MLWDWGSAMSDDAFETLAFIAIAIFFFAVGFMAVVETIR
jgi:hypothetical protein